MATILGMIQAMKALPPDERDDELLALLDDLYGDDLDRQIAAYERLQNVARGNGHDAG